MSTVSLSAASILRESAIRFADRPALLAGEASISYAQLWSETRAYAGALRELGVGPGDPVAVLIPNVPDFVRVYYAVLALGGVVVPVHALLKAEEIEYVLRDSGARLLVCAHPLLGEGRGGAEQAGVPVVSVMGPDPDADRLEDRAATAAPLDELVIRDPLDTATIMYTSGTTGTPKGALGSHLSLVEQVTSALLTTLDIRPDDVVFGGLPLFHTFGQTCTLNTTLRAGATLVLSPRFEPAGALRTLVERGCTILMGVPTMYVALLEAAKDDLRRPPLRYAVSGGAAISRAVLERFESVFGARVHEGYGLTETAPVATFNHVGREPRAGSIGTPIWGVDVEIADAETEDRIDLLPPDSLGELVIRGHGIMTGYLGRPEATAAAIVDGWFRTGDLGTKDADGYLWIVDRKKDMIVRNGYNVYPREIEERLTAHPAVADAAVFGVPDDLHGQEIVAHVVLAAGASATPEELSDFVRTHLAAYKYPRVIELVDALPLGPSGKVLKRELVARHSESV